MSTNGRSPDGSTSDGGSGITLPHASLDMGHHLGTGSPESQFRGSSGSPEMPHRGRSLSDPLMDMFLSGWDPDLPDPETLRHLYVH